MGYFGDSASPIDVAIRGVQATLWALAIFVPIWWHFCRVMAEAMIEAGRRRERESESRLDR